MSVPPVVSWILTARCNMQCPHCYVSAGPAAPGELCARERREAARKLAAAGVTTAFISGGEVLLLDDLDSLAALLRENGVAVSVCTPGTGLDEERAARLRASGVSGLSISLDSALPAEHDRFRGVPGAHRAALRAVSAARNAGIRVNVDVTPTQAAGRSISALVWLCEQAGADHLTVKRFRPTGRGADHSADLQLPQPEYRKILDTVLARVGRTSILLDVQDPAFHLYARIRGADLSALNRCAADGCMAARDWFGLQPDGTVTPCPLLTITLGHILRHNLPDLFLHSEAVAQIRDRRRRRGRCGRCVHADVCGGCRSHAWASSGDLLGEDPGCPVPQELCQ